MSHNRNDRVSDTGGNDDEFYFPCLIEQCPKHFDTPVQMIDHIWFSDEILHGDTEGFPEPMQDMFPIEHGDIETSQDVYTEIIESLGEEDSAFRQAFYEMEEEGLGNFVMTDEFDADAFNLSDKLVYFDEFVVELLNNMMYIDSKANRILSRLEEEDNTESTDTDTSTGDVSESSEPEAIEATPVDDDFQEEEDTKPEVPDPDEQKAQEKSKKAKQESQNEAILNFIELIEMPNQPDRLEDYFGDGEFLSGEEMNIFKVLLKNRDKKDGLSEKEISEKTALPKPLISDNTTKLTDLNIVEYDDNTGRYRYVG